MVINIAASTRFHLANLVVELERMGHDVRFYSYVPPRRLMSYGLSQKSIVPLFWLFIPVIALLRLSGRAAWSIKLEWFLLDFVVGHFMRRCDVFIAMSAIYVDSFRRARGKYGAKLFLERGSMHALSLKKLYDQAGLDRNRTYGNIYYSLVSDYAIRREQQMYEYVDVISIPSDHVAKSFVKNGISVEKLFVNPYGENLTRFPPTQLDQSGKRIYDVIMVGNWSWMKGCDLLIEACRMGGISLLHVGAHSMPFPEEELFHSVGTVDQREITNYMAQARVFVLPSRQEGLALVLVQAALSGLPIVCSENSGGTTIKRMINDDANVHIVDRLNVACLRDTLQKALASAKKLTGTRKYADNLTQRCSAEQYALRYHQRLVEIL